MADNAMEISMWIEFFEVNGPFSERTQKDYVGTLRKDGLRALAVPRVGENIFGLEVRLPIVTAVEHRIEGINAHFGEGEAEDFPPRVTVVVATPGPGDESAIEAFEARGWSWSPRSDTHA